jgi:hypothetical protein
MGLKNPRGHAVQQKGNEYPAASTVHVNNEEPLEEKIDSDENIRLFFPLCFRSLARIKFSVDQ